MLKLFIPLTVVLFIAACGPRDVAVKGRNGNNFNQQGGGSKSADDKKIAFSIDEDGERPETCHVDKKDYKFLVVPESDVDGALAGTITASIEPGNLNCFRIGSTVELKTSFTSKDILAEAVIKKTEALPLSKISKKQADQFGMTVAELKERGKKLISAFEAKNSFSVEGMVSITYFELPGNESVEDEGDDKDEEVVVKPGPKPEEKILIFDQNGERPSSCPAQSSDWKNISIPEDQDNAIKSGQVFGWLSAGARNCFVIGSTLQVKEKDSDSRMELRVVKVEVIPLAKMNITHSGAMDLNFMDFRDFALNSLKEASFKHNDMLNMTFFEYVEPAEATPAK